MNQLFSFSFLIVFVCLSNFLFAQKPFTIVIDPGHGGADVGARGRFSNEKDVALAVSLKLRDAVKTNFPAVSVIMTRSTDVTQNVKAKAQIANNAGGDLFISIHCNSAPKITNRELIGYRTETYYTGTGKKRKKQTRQVPQYRTWTEDNPAKGTETFIWSLDKVENKTSVLREYEYMYMDDEMRREMQNFDPDSPEKSIIHNLRSKQYFNRSASFAKNIEQEFINTGRESRMAKQRNKGIWVLQATAMPSVLIEIGFISNYEEEQYINSFAGQQEIVSAITRALRTYLDGLNVRYR